MLQDEETRKLEDRYVIEPVSANSLEAMERGMKTTYEHVTALSLGELLQEVL